MQLRKICLILILSMGIVLTGLEQLHADDTSEAILRLLIKKGIITKEEVEEIKAAVAKEEPAASQGLAERLSILEEKSEETGFLSLKGANFQLAGELEYEFVDTGGDGSDDKPHFQFDKFVLQPKIKIGDSLTLDAQIYIMERGADTKLNEIHAKFTELPLGSWIDAGLYERWLKSHHSRKTEGYPLLGTAFYRDDAMTLTWGGEFEPLYWMLSVGNGYEISNKQVAEDTADNNDILHDNHATGGLSDNLEYGINLGLKYDFAGAGKVDLLAFYYADELSDADRTYLESNLSGYTLPNNELSGNDKSRIGLGLKYKLADATLYGAYIDAKDGNLDRDSWLLEGSYNFKLDTDREWFTGIEPVISYSDYNVDNTKTTATPLSWNREKWIFATIIDLYKDTKLKLEYYINQEDTGGSGVDNDEFLAQLEVKF